MKHLFDIIESLLDTDFDVPLEEIKNWPRFRKRLQAIPTPAETRSGNLLTYHWFGTDVVQALTDAFKNDVGGSKVSKRAAIDALLEPENEPCIFATFKPQPGESYSGIIIICTYTESMIFNTYNEGSAGIQTKCVISKVTTQRLDTIEPRNWTIKKMPYHMYETIKRTIFR